MTDKNDDFFDEGQETLEQKQETPEKVKIGEKEYSQDELSGLVGLGEKAKELEDKWNTKIDRLYPEYTKKSQKLSEYEDKMKAFEEEKSKSEQEQLTKKSTEGELSPEEQAKLIKQELGKYGVVTKDDIFKYIADFNQGQQLINDIDKIAEEAKADGKPNVTRQELVDYMDENGVKNPNAAYKLMFESELKEWEAKQIGKIKRPGLVTEEGSTAGSKSPAPVKVTKDNLAQLLSAALEE